MQCPPTSPGRNGRLQHLLGVDPEAVEDQRELVDERDVDVALRVLDHLGRLGDADARRLVRARLDDARVQRVDEVGDFRRGARGDLLDRGQAMLLVAGVDAFRAVAGEEIAVEGQAGETLEDRHCDLLGASGIDRRFEHYDVALLEDLAEQLAHPLDRLEVGPLVAVDGRRHGHDEDLAAAQVLDAGRIAQVLRGTQLRGLALQRAVASLLQLGDARGFDVEADGAVLLAELYGERQPDVTEADDADLAGAQAEFRHWNGGLGVVREGGEECHKDVAKTETWITRAL